METVLMIVTVIALVLAMAMAVLAWRLLRENRQRSAARADALQAMASAEGDDRFTELEDTEPCFELEERDDHDAREPTTDWDWALAESRSAPAELAVKRPPSRRAPMPQPMFGSTVEPRRTSGTRWLALAAAGLVMAALGSAVYTFYGSAIAAELPLAEWTRGEPRSAPRPLELLSLRHTNDPNGTFTVTGLVQNPTDGATLRKVMAVVYLFDRDGNYFGGGKATLDFDVLQGGAESSFIVRVPNVTRVSRYRVGFRSESDGVVAHIDRRGQAPAGLTANGLDTPAGAQAR